MSSEGLSASVEPTAPGAPSGQSKTVLSESANHVVAGNVHSETSNARCQIVFIQGFSRGPYYRWKAEPRVLGMISACALDDCERERELDVRHDNGNTVTSMLQTGRKIPVFAARALRVRRGGFSFLASAEADGFQPWKRTNTIWS